jgi:hypothetical protein
MTLKSAFHTTIKQIPKATDLVENSPYLTYLLFLTMAGEQLPPSQLFVLVPLHSCGFVVASQQELEWYSVEI